MTPEATALRQSLVHAKSIADNLQRQLAEMERACQHDWTDAEYDPDYQDAYTYPGDPPGTMGVDWRGPVHVPAKTTKRWRRTCTKCGLVQSTTKVKIAPGAEGGLGKEVADFGTGNYGHHSRM